MRLVKDKKSRESGFFIARWVMLSGYRHIWR